MKWILTFLLLISITMQSQNVIKGDWYHISTGRLVQLVITDNRIGYNDKTFEFGDKEEKKDIFSIIEVFWNNNIAGIVYKNEDTSKTTSYELTVLQYSKDSGSLDLWMGCENSTQDTTGIHSYFTACDLPGKMIMRFYSRAVVDSFRKLKPVAGITKNVLIKINSSFKKKTDLLIKEFGEDKLLWVAPIIFQQVLTDLLLENGYNPMITQDQAEKLFEFYFF